MHLADGECRSKQQDAVAGGARGAGAAGRVEEAEGGAWAGAQVAVIAMAN